MRYLTTINSRKLDTRIKLMINDKNNLLYWNIEDGFDEFWHEIPRGLDLEEIPNYIHATYKKFKESYND